VFHVLYEVVCIAPIIQVKWQAVITKQLHGAKFLLGFLAFYGIGKFIILLTRAFRLSLSCDRAVQPTSQFTS
jgi:hypothetical protein